MSKHTRDVRKYGSAKAVGIRGRCDVSGCKKKAESEMIFDSPVPDGRVGAEDSEHIERRFRYCWKHSYGMVVEELSQTRHRLQQQVAIVLVQRKRLKVYEPDAVPYTGEEE